jgi:hypothetical protein
MTKSLLFKTAHKNAKEMKRNYPKVNYRVQFGLELKALYAKINNNTKGEIKMNKETNYYNLMISEFRKVDSAMEYYADTIGAIKKSKEERIKENKRKYQEYLDRQKTIR